MTWKTTKHIYDNIKFMSMGEVEFYKQIKSSGLEFEYQPEKIEIMPKFTGMAGKKYQAMNYEPDFLITKQYKIKAINKQKDNYGQMVFKTIKIYIEVKGQNDNIYVFKKGQPPKIQNKTDLYTLRHKLFDNKISKNGHIFMVVRDNQLKSPEYAGQFWDQDLQQLRKHKTENRKDLCAKIPRAIDRIKMILDCYGDDKQMELDDV